MADIAQKIAKNIRNFASDWLRYTQDEETAKFLSVFEELEFNKLVIIFYKKIHPVETRVKEGDETLFNEPFIILPGVNLSPYWGKLSSERKKKIWIYLRVIYNYCLILINRKEDEEKNNMTFNPYIGTEKKNENFGVEEMFSGPDVLPGEEGEGKNGLISQLLGAATGGFDLNKLREELKNITDEDMNESIEQIKTFMNLTGNDKASEMVDNLMNDIRSEIKNDGLESGDLFSNLRNIADNVAKKQQEKGADTGELLKATENLTKNLGNSEMLKNNLGGINPFTFLGKMTGKDGKMDPKKCERLMRQMGLDPNVVKKQAENMKK